jgi:aminocarboxymuconate-semialdehyde decarboxylase
VIVDIHTHFIPSFVIEEATGPEGCFGVRAQDGWLVHPEGFRYPVDATFHDAATKLAAMDVAGIDVSVLSIAPTLFFYDHSAEEAVAFARRANDTLAALIATSERLLGMATLPLQEPGAAVDELRRAVGELGLRGAHVGTNVGARSLDDPALEPLMATADQLDVPLMLHPYYVGVKPGLEDYNHTNSIGNPLDTTVAAARLIHSGIFDRLESLRIVLVHAGGFLPFQIGRLDHAHSVRSEPKRAIERPPSSYLDRFWMDSITHGDAALRFLASAIDGGRLVMGTDLPFDMADARPVERLVRVGIDPHVLGASAMEVLGLKARTAR